MGVSSTNRGKVRSGGPEDFFATPSWTVRRLLEVYTPRGGLWLEPAAGSGHIIRAVNEVRKDVRWFAWEIREQESQALVDTGATVRIGNFLTEGETGFIDIAVVIGNPPFQDAYEFVQRARAVAPLADVCLQLRLNFVGSEERAEFMQRCPPDVKTLPNRPSYVLRQTDSIEYAWLIWKPGERDFGTFQVLASTSITERQRDMPQVAKCPGACAGSGWVSKDGLPAQKKSAYADHPCGRCFGFGKIKAGPSEVERAWGLAA